MRGDPGTGGTGGRRWSLSPQSGASPRREAEKARKGTGERSRRARADSYRRQYQYSQRGREDLGRGGSSTPGDKGATRCRDGARGGRPGRGGEQRGVSSTGSSRGVRRCAAVAARWPQAAGRPRDAPAACERGGDRRRPGRGGVGRGAADQRPADVAGLRREPAQGPQQETPRTAPSTWRFGTAGTASRCDRTSWTWTSSASGRRRGGRHAARIRGGQRHCSRSALAVWRGPAFPDLGVTGADAAEVAALEEQRLGVLEDRVDADLDAGRGAELVAELDALVATYPLRERLHGQRMVALYRAGRQADALQAYQTARETLLDQLGDRAGARAGPDRAGGAAAGPVAGVVACRRPGPGRCSPHPPIHCSGGTKSCARWKACWVPGRSGDGLRGGGGRASVVSLLGPGGTGKSRLALEVARRLQPSFPHGVFFVPLAAVTDPRLVMSTIANTLRVKETPERPLASVVADRLADQVTCWSWTTSSRCCRPRPPSPSWRLRFPR